jgi:hypothetical protein
MDHFGVTATAYDELTASECAEGLKKAIGCETRDPKPHKIIELVKDPKDLKSPTYKLEFTNSYKSLLFTTAEQTYLRLLKRGMITEHVRATMTKLTGDQAFLRRLVSELKVSLPEILEIVKVVDGAYVFDEASFKKYYLAFANNEVGGGVEGYGFVQEELLACMFAIMAVLVFKQRETKSDLKNIDPAGAPYSEGKSAISYSRLPMLIWFDPIMYSDVAHLFLSDRFGTIEEAKAKIVKCFDTESDDELLANFRRLYTDHPLTDETLEKYRIMTRSRKTPQEIEELRTKVLFLPVLTNISANFTAVNAINANPKFVPPKMPAEIEGDEEKIRAFKEQVATLKKEHEARSRQEGLDTQRRPENILALLTKTFTAFSNSDGEMHTGKLGCGAFGNEPGIVAAVQIVAWFLVNRIRGTKNVMYFHAMGDKVFDGQFPESYNIAKNLEEVIAAIQQMP